MEEVRPLLEWLHIKLLKYHVCGEHEWDEGEFQYGPLTELEFSKTIIAKDSKPAKELRAIVFDKKWLKSLNFYVFFR